MKKKMWNRILGGFLAVCMILNLFAGFAGKADTAEAADTTNYAPEKEVVTDYALRMDVVTAYRGVTIALDKTLEANTSYTLEMDYYVASMGTWFGARLGGIMDSISSVPSLNEWHTYSKTGMTTEASNEFKIYGASDGTNILNGYFKNIRVKDATGAIVARAELTLDTSFTVDGDGYQGNSHGVAAAPVAETEYAAHVTASGSYHAVQLPLDYTVPAGTYTLEMDYYVVTMGTQFQPRMATKMPPSVTKATLPSTNQWYSYAGEVTTEVSASYFDIFVFPEFEGYFKNLRVRNEAGDIVADVDLTSVTSISRKEGAASTYSQAIVEAPEEVKIDEYAVRMNVATQFRGVKIVLDKELQADTSYTLEMDYYVTSMGTWFGARLGGIEHSISSVPSLNEWHTYSKTGTTTAASNEFKIYGASDGTNILNGYFKNIRVKDATGAIVARAELTLGTSVTVDGNDYAANSHSVSAAPVAEKEYAAYISGSGAFQGIKLPLDSAVPIGTYTVEMDYYVVKTGNWFHARLGGGEAGKVQASEFDSKYVKCPEQWYTHTSSVTSTVSTTEMLLYVAGDFEGYFKNLRIKNAAGDVVAEVDMTSVTGISTDASSGTYSYKITEAPVAQDYALYMTNTGGSYDLMQVRFFASGAGLPANQTYTVSMNYYAKTFTGANAGFEPRVGTGGDAATTVHKLSKIEEGAWYPYEYQVTPTTSLESIYFYLFPSIEIYVDDIMIKDADGKVVATQNLAKDTWFWTDSAGIEVVPYEPENNEDEGDNPEIPPVTEDYMLYLEHTGTGYDFWSVTLDTELAANTAYKVSFDYYVDVFVNNGVYSAFQPRFGGQDVTMPNAYTNSVETDTWLSYSGEGETTTVVSALDFYIFPSAKLYIDNIRVELPDGTLVTEVMLKDGVVSEGSGVGSGIYELVTEIKEDQEPGGEGGSGDEPIVPDYPTEDEGYMLYMENLSDAYDLWSVRLSDGLDANTTYTVTFDYYVAYHECLVYSAFQPRYGGQDITLPNVYTNSVATEKWQTYSGTGTTTEATSTLDLYLFPKGRIYVDNIKITTEDGSTAAEVLFADGIVQEQVGAGSGNFKLLKDLTAEDKAATGPKPLVKETGEDRALYLENTSDAYYSWAVKLSNKLMSNTKYTVTFEYFLDEYNMTGEYIALQPRLDYNDISLKAATDKKLGKWHTYSDSMVITNSTEEIYFFLFPTIKVHINNVIIKDAAGNTVSTALITSNTIVRDRGGAGKGVYKLEANIPQEDKTVYAYKIWADPNAEELQQSIWFATTFPTPGTEIIFEMDYYLEGGNETARVYNVHGGAGLSDDKTGYSDLDLGVNHYKGTFIADETTPGLHFGVSMSKNDPAILYVWNVKVYVDGVEKELPEKEEVLKNGTIKREIVKYQDIVFKPVPGSDPNLPANIDPNPGGKLMLKQENYKYREEYGLLTYQEFTQYVGEKQNGSVIKENTTYVFSFEYYGDPGTFGSGVNTATAVWLSLNTGHNDTITEANQHLLWDEANQRRGAKLMPNFGRHHIEVEYTTMENQTDFKIGICSGWDGDAYYWDFKLVEKGGDGTNLLKYTDFEGSFASMTTTASDGGTKRAARWRVSKNSADALGSYSFVPFDDEIAALGEGEVLKTEKIEKPVENEEVKQETPVAEEKESNGALRWVILSTVAGVVLVGGTLTALTIKKKRKEKQAGV